MICICETIKTEGVSSGLYNVENCDTHHILMYYLVNSKTLSSLLLPPPHPPPLFLPLPLSSPSLPLPQRRGRRYTRVFKRKEPIEACIEIERTGSHDYRVWHVCLSSHHAGDKGTARLYFKSEGFLGGPAETVESKNIHRETDGKSLSRPPAGKIHSYLKEVNLLLS